MSNARPGRVDLVKELQLRRWARQNYVPAGQRSGQWHSIVLDEMHQRDVELASRRDAEPAARPPGERIGSPYVPLLPTELRRLDKSHNQANLPAASQAESRQSRSLISDL